MRLFVVLLCVFTWVSCDLIFSPEPQPVVVEPTNPVQQESKSGRLAWQKPNVVLNTLGDIRDKKIADIGAGAGYFTFRMIKRGANVIAIDVDTQMIQLVELFKENLDSIEQTRVMTRIVPPANPMLSPEEVDIAMMINTAAYISDRVDYFDKVRRGIKASNGLLVIVDFAAKRDIPSKILRSGEPTVDYTILTEELREAGFNLIRVNESHLPYQYIIYALP